MPGRGVIRRFGRQQPGPHRHLSGGSWSSAEAPLPADAVTSGQTAYLTSLSCPATGTCVAVGDYDNANGSQGLIETLSDGIWVATTMQAPANSVFPSEPNTSRGTVSCPTVDWCQAVWGYEDTVGTLGDVFETLSGGGWTPLEAPLPSNVNPDTLQSALTDLTCQAAGSCVAVGTYNINPYGYDGFFTSADGLIETLSGGHGRPRRLRSRPTSGRRRTPGSGNVRCPAVGSCVAIGSYDDSGGILRDSSRRCRRRHGLPPRPRCQRMSISLPTMTNPHSHSTPLPVR